MKDCSISLPSAQSVDCQSEGEERGSGDAARTITRAVRSRRSESQCASTSGCLRGAPPVTPIQRYTPSLRVSSSNGRHDKIEIHAKYNLPDLDDEEELFALRRHLGAPPKNLREEENRDVYGRLLTVAPSNGEGRILKFRKEDLREGEAAIPAPLLEGKTTVSGKPSGGQISTTATAYAHLNPSRAINRNAAGLAHDSEEDPLLGRTEEHFLRGLDGEDNLIAKGVTQAAYREMEEDYLYAAVEGIRDDLSRAFRLSQGSLELSEDMGGAAIRPSSPVRLERLSLRTLETYWEMTVEDAPRFLERITPTLKAFHSKHREREHGARLDHASDVVSEGNAKSVRLFLSKGEEIQVYAKEQNRIRFEVRHKPGDNPRLLEVGHTAGNLERLREKMDQLRERACERINLLLEFLETWQDSTPGEFASTPAFVLQWTDILGRGDDSIRLLENLCSAGRIVGGRSLPESQQALLKKAKKTGLVSSNGRGLYRPNPEVDGLTLSENTPNVSYTPVTQASQSGDVSRSFSTPENAGVRVPPSPCFMRSMR